MVYPINSYHMFTQNKNYIRNIEVIIESDNRCCDVYPSSLLPPVTYPSSEGVCEAVVSDVYDLFNQERISKYSPEDLRNYIEQNYPHSSEVSKQISKMTDDEIFLSIKPRNIQSASELRSWIESSFETMQEISSRNNLLNQQQQQEQQQQEQQHQEQQQQDTPLSN